MLTHDGGFLPWQVEQARAWLMDRERYAHAWLIHGLNGIGQVEFALAGAAALLCESPVAGLACGSCQACGWVAAGNHPDLRRIRPDATAQREGWGTDVERAADSPRKQASREIRVDQVRTLFPWFNTATHRGGWRVAVLYPAETLNVISANTLLKILEEPPANTVFLLAGESPDRLLPTLVSRCRRLPLSVPSPEQARSWLASQGVEQADEWLAACGGAPLLARERAAGGGPACPEWIEAFLELCDGRGTAGDLADALANEEIANWIDGFQRLLVDLSLNAGAAPSRYFPVHAARIQALAARLDGHRLAEAAHWLVRQRRLGGHALNPRFLADHAVTLLLRACSPAAVGG